MDLDIIRKIKFPHVKASFDTLALKHKFFLIIFLVSIVSTIVPHQTFAAVQQPTQTQDAGPVLIFDTGNTDYQDFLDQLNQDLTDKYYQQEMVKQAMRLERLSAKVKTYLASHGSPLANYSNVLVSLRNWKKIVALSNAESSLCLHYPVGKANCWGVGGADLWDMGSDLGQGVVSMNHFLNKYPLHSGVKYAQMPFEKMNGLYKQPPADHWVNNNKIVYQDLATIEASIQ